MPTLTEDFLNPAFGHALYVSIKNGLIVLVVLSVLAALLTFMTGGTAPKNWPKKDAAEH